MKYKVTKADRFVWLVIEDADIAELLYKKGWPIYKLYDDDSEGYPENCNDIRRHIDEYGGLMGVGMGFAADLTKELIRG